MGGGRASDAEEPVWGTTNGSSRLISGLVHVLSCRIRPHPGPSRASTPHRSMRSAPQATPSGGPRSSHSLVPTPDDRSCVQRAGMRGFASPTTHLCLPGSQSDRLRRINAGWPRRMERSVRAAIPASGLRWRPMRIISISSPTTNRACGWRGGRLRQRGGRDDRALPLEAAQAAPPLRRSPSGRRRCLAWEAVPAPPQAIPARN